MGRLKLARKEILYVNNGINEVSSSIMVMLSGSEQTRKGQESLNCLASVGVMYLLYFRTLCIWKSETFLVHSDYFFTFRCIPLVFFAVKDCGDPGHSVQSVVFTNFCSQ